MKNHEVKVYEVSTADEFLKKGEKFLLENESLNNILLGLANSISHKDRPADAELYILVEVDGNIVGAALRTDQRRAILISHMDDLYIDSILSFIINKNIELSGVNGKSSQVESFAKKYCKSFDLCFEMETKLGIYELNKLLMPKNSAYLLRVINDEDFDITLKFVESFIRDCFPKEENFKFEAQEMAKRFITNKSVYFLLNPNNEIVSMAANVRQTKNTACVGFVYTPDNFRKKGYGSLVTALVSKEILDGGKMACNLYTDLSNPTSNSIYQKIGYRKIGESIHFKFYKK